MTAFFLRIELRVPVFVTFWTYGPWELSRSRTRLQLKMIWIHTVLQRPPSFLSQEANRIGSVRLRQTELLAPFQLKSLWRSHGFYFFSFLTHDRPCRNFVITWKWPVYIKMFGRYNSHFLKAYTFCLSLSRMASSTANSISKQNYDYFLVLDFEATCDSARKTHPLEIIEFPVLKINARTLECDSTFHTCQ